MVVGCSAGMPCCHLLRMRRPRHRACMSVCRCPAQAAQPITQSRTAYEGAVQDNLSWQQYMSSAMPMHVDHVSRWCRLVAGSSDQ